MALRSKALVEWSEPALEELAQIARYIHERDPQAAYRLLDRIDVAVMRLKALPMLGRSIPHAPNHRELIVRPCRVVYRVAAKTVLIVHVRRFERSSWPPLQ
jgi:toxin ParE1/3/4